MTLSEILMFIVKVLAGTGVFLVGVTLLTVNIEQLATTKIKNIFNKTQNKKIMNVGIGALTTALIQSSGVTSVLIVGFVNIGLINLTQATAMIMGANIGTTITAQVAALSAFPITTYIQILAFIGIIISMITNSDKIKKTSLIIAGLGLIFVGLSIMSKAMETNKDAIQSIFSVVTNPFLLLLTGIVLTAVCQSSSATTSVIIAMSVAGVSIGTGGNEVLFIILGTNIGSCVTALISSIGTSANAKRASLIHLLFNTFGAIIFFTIFMIMPSFMDVTFKKWFSESSTQIAMFHTFFNVICTLIFLPFTGIFVRLAKLFIKDKETPSEISLLDDRILSSPALAINQLEKEMIRLSDCAMEAFRKSYQSFLNKDASSISTVQNTIDKCNKISQNLISYLIKVSSKCSEREEMIVSSIHNNIGDVMRIAEIADNFTKYTKKSVDQNIEFSSLVVTEINKMVSRVEDLYKLTTEVLLSKNTSLLNEIDKVEDDIDTYRKSLVDSHVERLNQGTCKPESSGIFINLVSNLERLGDHLTYIAHTIE